MREARYQFEFKVSREEGPFSDEDMDEILIDKLKKGDFLIRHVDVYQDGEWDMSISVKDGIATIRQKAHGPDGDSIIIEHEEGIPQENLMLQALMEFEGPMQ